MLVPAGEVRETRIDGEVRPPDRFAEPLPELLLRAGDHDPAVRRGEVLEGNHRRVGRLREPLRPEAPGGHPRADVHELVQGGLEERDVAVAPDAVAPRLPEPGHERERGRVAAGEVDEREPALGRRPVRLAREAHPAGEALHDVVVAALGRARPGHPEAGERAADDARVDLLQVLVRDAEPLRIVAAEVRVDGVDGANEVLEHRPRLRVAQIEGDAPLVAVERLEEERVLPLLEGRHVAPDVPCRGGVLDLDHVGPEVGQLQGSPRARAVLLDREDADVRERERHARLRAGKACRHARSYAGRRYSRCACISEAAVSASPASIASRIL